MIISSLTYRLLNYSGEQSYRYKRIDYFNTLQIMNSLSIKHRGCTFFGSSEEEIKKRIEAFDFERSIFYKGSVYTYSYYARVLEDNSVEFTQRFDNGETTKKTLFKDKKEFWDNL